MGYVRCSLGLYGHLDLWVLFGFFTCFPNRITEAGFAQSALITKLVHAVLLTWDFSSHVLGGVGHNLKGLGCLSFIQYHPWVGSCGGGMAERRVTKEHSISSC